MRIAFAGTVNRDTIFTAGNERIESYGGLLYSVLPLAYIAPPEAMCFPICNVGQDVAETVLGLLEGRPLVRLDGVRIVREQNTHCVIRYDREGSKEETLLGGVPPLTFERFEPFLRCDAVCINFISGVELSLDTLKRVRGSTNALMAMDVHSLTLGMDAQRRRFLRVPDRWEEWLAQVDIVQMNEREAGLLAGSELTDDRRLRAFGARVLALGPLMVLITLGERGSITAYADDRVRFLPSPSRAPGPVLDQTGCGDAFLAGFIVEYLRSRDPAQASKFANRVAGANCCLRGIEEIERIGALVGSIRIGDCGLGIAD